MSHEHLHPIFQPLLQAIAPPVPNVELEATARRACSLVITLLPDNGCLSCTAFAASGGGSAMFISTGEMRRCYVWRTSYDVGLMVGGAWFALTESEATRLIEAFSLRVEE